MPDHPQKAPPLKVLSTTLGPALTVGIFIALSDFTFAASSSLYIFSGSAAPFFQIAISVLMVACVFPNLIVGLTGTLRGVLFAMPVSQLPVLAAMVASIALEISPTEAPTTFAATTLAAFAMGTATTGLAMFLTGRLNLSRLIRFFPYPMMGGFLAGLGIVNLLGAIATMKGTPVTVAGLPEMFTANALVHWVPGVVVGAALYFVQKRWPAWWIGTAGLAVVALVFFAVMWLTGTSIAEARNAGWLMRGSNPQSLWPALPYETLTRVDLQVVFAQFSFYGVLALLSVIDVLIGVSAIEMETGDEIELNHDMQRLGIANLVSATVGGGIGMHAASNSIAASKLRARSRLTPLVYLVSCVTVIAFGSKVLAFLPIPVLGAFLAYVGMSVFLDWSLIAARKFRLLDSVVFISIATALLFVGVMEGIAIGLTAALVVFAFQYSKVAIVKFSVPGKDFESNIDRSPAHRRLLDAHGDGFHVLVLQGYLFFGTASKLLDRVKELVRQPRQTELTHLVIDFRRVDSLDISTVFSMKKLLLFAQRNHLKLGLSQLTDPSITQLQNSGVLAENNEHNVRLFPTVSEAASWCQEEILAQHNAPSVESQSLDELLSDLLPNEAQRSIATSYFETKAFSSSDVLFRQGERGDGLFFVGHGEVDLTNTRPDGSYVFVKRLTAGSMFGEMALYSKGERSGTAVARTSVTLYHLPKEGWEQLALSHPKIAGHFHEFAVRQLTERLARTNFRLEKALR